jgi:hypothetical protein
MNVGDYGSVEQSLWWRVTPVLVLAGELDIGQVASDACHCDGTLPQILPKVEIKRVVLDVLISRIMLVKALLDKLG